MQAQARQELPGAEGEDVMNHRKLIAILALVGPAMIFIPAAQAEARGNDLELLDYEACRTLVEAGDILPMGELYQRVNEKVDGRMLDTVLVRRPQGYIYQMEIAGRDGVIRMIEVDAATGKVLTE